MGIIRSGYKRNEAQPSWAHSNFKYEAAELIRLCKEYGYWCGLLQLYLFAGELFRALRLAFMLDDDASFVLISSTLRLTVACWESLLPLLKARESAQSNGSQEDNIQPKISVESFLDAMCTSIGPETALTILKREFANTEELNSLVLKKLSHRFFQRILYLARTSQTLKNIAYEILETFDSYLWSLKTDVIAPSFRSIETLELQVRLFNSLPDQTPTTIMLVFTATTLKRQ